MFRWLNIATWAYIAFKQYFDWCFLTKRLNVVLPRFWSFKVFGPGTWLYPVTRCWNVAIPTWKIDYLKSLNPSFLLEVRTIVALSNLLCLLLFHHLLNKKSNQRSDVNFSSSGGLKLALLEIPKIRIILNNASLIRRWHSRSSMNLAHERIW